MLRPPFLDLVFLNMTSTRMTICQTTYSTQCNKVYKYTLSLVQTNSPPPQTVLLPVLLFECTGFTDVLLHKQP